MNNIKAIGACLAAVFTYLFGGMDTLMQVLMCMVAIDFLSGVLGAIVQQKLSSSIGFVGIAKKVGIFLVVAVAHILGQALGIAEIRSLVIGFYMANEGISILENISKMGVPFPDKLLDILQQLKDGKE